jgi:hypothetical protein
LLVSTVLPAKADLVSLGTADFSAQGFGNANRLITLQGQGNSTTESGAVIPVNGTVSGSGDVVSPLSDNQKFGVPTLGQLGWTTASQVQLLFNAAEPGGDGATIGSLTLSFYDGNNLVYSISNSQPLVYRSTEPGNGSAGFLIGVSLAELADVNSGLFSLPNFTNFRLGISAALSDVAGGPESFNAVSAVALPPSALAFGTGLVGLMVLARRRRKGKASHLSE